MRSLPLKGLSVLTILTIALVAAATLLPRADRVWVQVMIGIASLEGLLGFWSLSLALRRSNQVFFGVFAGGMLLRLLLIGMAATVLVHWAPSVTWPLISLVGTFFLFSMIQLPFLQGSFQGVIPAMCKPSPSLLNSLEGTVPCSGTGSTIMDPPLTPAGEDRRE